MLFLKMVLIFIYIYIIIIIFLAYVVIRYTDWYILYYVVLYVLLVIFNVVVIFFNLLCLPFMFLLFGVMGVMFLLYCGTPSKTRSQRVNPNKYIQIQTLVENQSGEWGLFCVVVVECWARCSYQRVWGGTRGADKPLPVHQYRPTCPTGHLLKWQILQH